MKLVLLGVMIDSNLIKGCLKNDPVSQRELYRKYSPKMMAVCYRYAHNREDAEDMLQEGFIKVFDQISKFKSLGSFEGWIRKIMVHTCINLLKKNKKFSDNLGLELANGIPSGKDTVPSIIQAKQIIDCIRMLPTGYRTVLNLYALEGYSHKEIGKILEIEESTSRSQYTRAKAMLETILIKMKIIADPKMKNDWISLVK